MANAPIVILGNKIDIPGAVSEHELRYVLGISTATTGKVSDLRSHVNTKRFSLFSSAHRFREQYLVQISMVVQWNYLCVVFYDVKDMVKRFDGYPSIYKRSSFLVSFVVFQWSSAKMFISSDQHVTGIKSRKRTTIETDQS